MNAAMTVACDLESTIDSTTSDGIKRAYPPWHLRVISRVVIITTS